MKRSYLLESTLLLLCLISASLQVGSPPFESGLSTLMVQKTTGKDLGHVVPFSLSFRERFQSPPLVLVAPLTFANDPSLLIDANPGGFIWAKVQLKSINEGKVELAIESSLQSISLKISYLFISEELARSAGIYIMNPVVGLQYNPLMNGERRGMVKITEIINDQSGKTEKFSREGYGVLPFESALGKFYIFSNELKLMQNGKNYYDLVLQQEEDSLQVRLMIDTDQILSIEAQTMAYTLVLQLQNYTPDQHIVLSFKQVLVSIPAISLSRQISSGQSLFVGLSGYFIEQSQDFLGVDFTQAEKAYLISRRSPSSLASLLNMTIITFTESQSSNSSSYTSRLLLTCASPTYSTTYVNSWTTWSFPTKSSTTTCQPCPTGCFSCSYCADCYRYVNCTVCRTGFRRQEFEKDDYQEQQVCRCISGYPNSITNTCMACQDIIPNCVSCYAGSTGHFSATCATCKTGYYGVPNTGSWSGSTQCGACVAGCATCKNIPTNCSSCATGFTKTNGSCICSVAGTYYNAGTKTCTSCALAIPNCGTCVLGVTTTCSACASKFYLSGGTCVACQPNCNVCTASSCTTCQATFVPSGTNCICSTSPQMVLNAAGTGCVLCTSVIPSCSACSGNGTGVTCTTCSPGTFAANSTSCQTCPATCATCSAATCLTCVNNLIVVGTGCDCDNGAGFYLNTLTKTCVSCQQSFPACSACNISGSTLTCVACDTGFYLTATGCAICPATCRNCTDFTTCEDCVTGYQLAASGATATMCGCVNCTLCASNNVTNCAYCDLTTPGSFFCVTCDASSFLTTGTAGTCTLCPQECATCLDANTCLTCQPDFIMSTPPGSCICNNLALLYYTPGPPPTCVSCVTVAGMSSDCTACAPTGNSTGDLTICTACSPGSFLTGGNCSPCTYPCDTCTNTSTTCTSCEPSYILSGTSCVCDNADQMFEDTVANPRVCVGCAAILGITECQVCSLNSSAVSTSGVACSTCQPGTYPDNFFLCSPCPPTCTTCTGPTTCNTCLPTYSLLPDNSCACDTANSVYQYGDICLSCYAIFNYCETCIPSGGSIVCSDCGTGTYLAADQLSCILCPVNCDDCSAGGVCNTCSPGYFKNGAGICDCNTTCVAYSNADASCLECGMSAPDPVTNSSSLQCYACKLTTFLVGNESCNACPPSCATCSDYVVCLTCMPSYTLINSNCQCNTEANFVDDGSGVCKSCGFLSPGCQSCTYASGVTTCTGCIDGYVLDNGACLACGLGCKVCTAVAGVTAGHCVTCFSPDFILNTGTYDCDLVDLANTCLYTDSLHYDGTGTGTCTTPCSDPFCATCYEGTTCTACKGTFEYIMGKCVCNAGRGMFVDRTTVGSEVCISCQASAYLINCKICQENLASTYASKIQCLECADGYYLSGGTCLPCMPGCQKCSTSATCCSCNSPSWLMINGTCDCNNNLNYFTDNAGQCLTCNISNCTKCSNLTTCIACNLDSFVNSAGICQLSVCGNGDTEGIEQCDDGNAIGGDGCTACQIDTYYFCINTPPPSDCRYDDRFNVKVAAIEAACNKITFKFQIYPYYNYYDGANFDAFINTNTLNASTKLTGITRSDDTVSFAYTYNKKLQGLSVSFLFDPSALMIPQTIGYPPISMTFDVVPTNNVLALYYEDDICESTASLQQLATAVEYGSYATMALSALPCKIVGLELTGVVQLAFFSMASMDNVNIMMSPMMGLKGINGYTHSLGKDPEKKRLLQTQTLTPSRINSIGYNANFLRNCNVMLILVLAVIGLASILYIITYIFKDCAATLHRVAKRLIKEVLLTLILFNCLNFAYSAGVHFRYAVPEDDLYLFGTLAAVATLVIPVLMAIGLSMSEEEGFGEFKDKMKPGCIEKAYFVITIIYRMCLGLYMSTSNEDQLSTLIVLALSIGFLLYNLVNLPFTKAYHNYRANICHFCQFIVLFVAMYYRSMKSSASNTQVANIYSPVYLEYACITISLVVSLVVLFYDGYIWLRECCSGDEGDHNRVAPREHRSNSNASLAENKLHITMKSLESEGNEAPIEVNIGDEYESYK